MKRSLPKSVSLILSIGATLLYWIISCLGIIFIPVWTSGLDLSTVWIIGSGWVTLCLIFLGVFVVGTVYIIRISPYREFSKWFLIIISWLIGLFMLIGIWQTFAQREGDIHLLGPFILMTVLTAIFVGSTTYAAQAKEP